MENDRRPSGDLSLSKRVLKCLGITLENRSNDFSFNWTALALSRTTKIIFILLCPYPHQLCAIAYYFGGRGPCAMTRISEFFVLSGALQIREKK